MVLRLSARSNRSFSEQQQTAVSNKSFSAHSITSAVFYDKTAFQLKVDHPKMCVFRYMAFCARDHHDPMTLRYELNLHIFKMYPCTKNDVCRSQMSNVGTQTGQTHIQTNVTKRIIIIIFVLICRVQYTKTQRHLMYVHAVTFNHQNVQVN